MGSVDAPEAAGSDADEPDDARRLFSGDYRSETVRFAVSLRASLSPAAVTSSLLDRVAEVGLIKRSN